MTQPALPALAEAWREAKAADPHARARDIADKLGVSEGALVEARVGDGVTRLGARQAELIPLLEALRPAGPLMTLTRNDAAVHETTGDMGEVAAHGMMGQVVGAIDLRMFLRHWHAPYLVAEETRSGLRHSVQVFDAAGRAVIKIYATEGTDRAVWDGALAPHLDESAREVGFMPPEPPKADAPDEEVDRAALREKWQSLEHSHDFHKMLREVGAGRQQALRLAGEDLALPVETDTLRHVLEGAAAQDVPLMCFVGNPGCIQIYSGPVHMIKPMGPWLNVLDPSFNLHLRTDRVAQAWRVRKPTSLRGTITSLELFDTAGEIICQFFGARPPGEGELPAWRSLVETATGGTP
ncbi:MAG: ChuX/HutX family heme-like substrate-binding protein [Pseudomonadota bacterium]